MIGKILQKTKGKPCSCPEGKVCTACKRRESVRVKPQIRVEGANNLPVPIKITTYKDKTEKVIQPKKVQPKEKKETRFYYQKPAPVKLVKPTEKVIQPKKSQPKEKKETRFYYQKPAPVYKDTTAKVEPTKVQPTKVQPSKVQSSKVQPSRKRKSRSHFRKPIRTESVSRNTKICQWYRKRKALRELNRINKAELKRLEYLRLEKARREREAEFYERLLAREQAIRQAEEELDATPQVVLPVLPVHDTTKKKQRHVKEVPYVEPTTTCTKVKKTKDKKIKSRSVCTKVYKPPKPSFNERFANFCYRICCQFYCCVTFILIIGCLIIFFM